MPDQVRRQLVLFRLPFLVVSAALPLLIGCASTKNSPSANLAPAPIIEVRGDTAVYRGSLTAEGLAKLKSMTQDAKITTLLASSPGGEIGVSIDFGLWVHENELDVVIGRACLSSCANYIFPAGRKKTIPPGSVVAWHGSATQQGFQKMLTDETELRRAARSMLRERQGSFTEEELEEEVQRFFSYMRETSEKQARFYQLIGVDEAVTRIGNEEYGVDGFFSMSVEDMARFGIDNVTASADYIETDLHELNDALGDEIEFITVGP